MVLVLLSFFMSLSLNSSHCNFTQNKKGDVWHCKSLCPMVLTVLCSVCFTGGLRGASIVDSLDTLYIMGLMDEYNDAKEWVETSLDLNSVRSNSLIGYYLCHSCWRTNRLPQTLSVVVLVLRLILGHIFSPD